MRISYCILLIALLASSCRQPKELVYQDVQNFGMKQAGLKNTTLTMDVRLYNPNKYSLKLKSADIDVLLNDNSLGKISVDSKLKIPGLDTFSLPIILNVDLATALPNLIQLALSGGDVNIKLSGTILAGRHGVFIKIPVNYEGSQDILSGIKF